VRRLLVCELGVGLLHSAVSVLRMVTVVVRHVTLAWSVVVVTVVIELFG
jgi:hypothetical protein